MDKLIDENGFLNIEDLLLNNSSLQAIMADNIITQEEKNEQSAKVVNILKEIGEKCNDEQIELVRQLMAEFSAFIIVCQSDTRNTTI